MPGFLEAYSEGPDDEVGIGLSGGKDQMLAGSRGPEVERTWEREVYKGVSRYLLSLCRLLGAQASERLAIPGTYLLYASASCLRAPPCACGCLLGRVLSTPAGGRPGRSGWRDELPWRSASIPGLSKAAMSGHTRGDLGRVLG